MSRINKYEMSFLYARGKFRGKVVIPLTDDLFPIVLTVEAVSEKQATFLLYRELDKIKNHKVHVVRDMRITVLESNNTMTSRGA